MGNSKGGESTSQRAEPSDEPEAPPYVLHRHPISPDEIETLPTYTAQYDPNGPINITELNDILKTRGRPRGNDLMIWQRYIDGLESRKESDEDKIFTENCRANHFFSAIDYGQQDVIALLIENHIVTSNTKLSGTTPLLMAVFMKNVAVVQQLLDLGADPNEFSSLFKVRYWDKQRRIWGVTDPYSTEPQTLRTPLQLAASLGHLVIVKLLMEQYHCDDSLVAPDGQIALRLAAENGHREVVDYLPARRGGGFRRWQHKNKKALRRIKVAAIGIMKFVKFFVWDVEKFFLWSVPKHCIVKPSIKASKWCWKHRREFGPWCVRQAREMPGRVVNSVEWIGRTIARFVKWLWKAILKIPEMIKDLAVWIWKLVTVKIPRTIALLARWVADGLTSVAKVVWNAILKVVSFLSTVVSAIVSFFRALTLKDVWNGFCEALKAVFIALPKLVWSWILAFGDKSYKLLKSLLGGLGEILWYLGYGIQWVVTYIPRKLWIMLESLGGVIVKAGYELRVWMDPKAS